MYTDLLTVNTEACWIDVARTVEEVEHLRPLWQRMPTHPDADLDFYLTIVRSREEVERPHVIVLGRGERPRLLLIGRIESRPLPLSIGYKTIQGPRVRTLMVLYQGLLGQGSLADYACLLEELKQTLKRGEADYVHFNYLPNESYLYRLAGSSLPIHCRDLSGVPNPHYRLTLGRSYEDYQQSLSRATRKTLRRYAKRLESEWAGRLRLVCYSRLADHETIMRDCEAIARTTYQRQLGVGFREDEEMRRRTRLELERGWLRAYVLYLEERPAAFSFVLCSGEMAYANETGYDPAFREWRVGHYLNEKVIEDLCLEPGLEALDYGFGDADYKRAICDQVWDESLLYIFAPTLRGLALRAMVSGVRLLTEWAKAAMGRLGLLSSLKRTWRRRLTLRELSQGVALIYAELSGLLEWSVLALLPGLGY